MGLCKGPEFRMSLCLIRSFLIAGRAGRTMPRVFTITSKKEDIAPFYDHIGMENGRFGEQIRRNLINAINFVLILSKGALDRAGNEGD